MKTLIAATVLLLTAMTARAQQVISLEGAWDFAIGDETTVTKKGTVSVLPRSHYDDYVMLPGSMLTNGKGDDVTLQTQWTGSLYDSSYYFNPRMEAYRQAGQLKLPFFLTPAKHYVGAAWYRKKIYVPKDWDGQRITLFLERPHIETTVYVNGKEVGHGMSLSTPHRYDVSHYIKGGKNNDIAIRVYNGIENVGVGQDSHSVTDQTQGNWNGIVGRIELQAQWKKLNIKRVRIIPGGGVPQFKVVVELENHVPSVRVMPFYDYYVKTTLRRYDPAKQQAVGRELYSQTDYIDGLDKAEFTFITNNEKKPIYPWDEFHPMLYHLTIEAGDDVREMVFGLRDISIEGRQMYINERPLFLRGTVESCIFPETGYPPTDKAEWLTIFRKCKEWGLNHVRFHSYCPPEAAFAAADEVGIYLQPEGPSWPNHGVKLRRGQVIDKYLLEESKRIVDEYGHHPSFIMMAAGNEPAGDWVGYCNDWVRRMHDYDSTRVYCGASVGGGWAWDSASEYHVKGGARGLDWDRHAPSSDDDYYEGVIHPRNFKPEAPAPQTSRKRSKEPMKQPSSTNDQPLIAHEQGQWCAFPDLKETSQYTGVYRAANLDIFRDLLAQGGMARQAEKFLMASGRLQTLCYKYEIERNLRTPDYAGFQLLGLSDYSGQGTATVGPLNAHWHEKGYVTAKEWKEFCSPIVVLAKFPKFVYTNDEQLIVPIEIMNAFYANLKTCQTQYTILQGDTAVVARGNLALRGIPMGKNTDLGTIRLPLDKITEPSKMTLTVTVENVVKNHWDFWVYQKPTPDPSQREEPTPTPPEGRGLDTIAVDTTAVDSTLQSNHLPSLREGSGGGLFPSGGDGSRLFLITDTLDQAALDTLRAGGCVLLTAAGRVTLGSDVRQTYLPVFWNTSWFKMRPPHTTGAYIDATHPLFRHGFPTDEWSNLNWWELLNHAQVMNLMELPASYQPPIQPIDTWHVSRKLAMLIEANVLGGRLLMTTMDISNNLDTRHVARQMRRAILSYMQSDDFRPTLTLTPDVVGHFFTRQAPPVDMYTRDSPDELKPKVVDGGH